MNNSKEFIDNWYGKYLPSFQNFINFSVRSCEFANHIAGVNRIHIDARATTGYMNDKGEIYHPACFYMKEFYTEFLGIPEDEAIYAAISFHNGVSIHEALHVKLTPLTWVRTLKGEDKTLNALLSTAFNIIEDIYIEEVGRQDYSGVFPFKDIKNQIDFTEEKTIEYLSDLENKTNLVNACISWKNVGIREIISEQLPSEFVSILKSATNSGLTFFDRIKIARELYDLLVENGVTSDDVNGDGNLDNDGEMSLSKEFYEALQKFVEANRKELEKLVKQFEDAYYDINPSRLIEISDNFKNLQKNIQFEFNIRKGGDVKLDKRFSNFAHYIQTVRTPKPDYSLVKDRGNDILDRELYRISIDGNVLTDKVYRTIKRDKPEFLILVDSSGSMGDIYSKVVSAAGSIYMSLIMSDIPVSLWGHSGREYPVIYGIAAYKMPFRNKRVETTQNPMISISNAINIPLSQNYDSFVIQSLSEYFTNSRKRFMIVLSDGLPEGYDYGGKSAREHLVKVIGNCRKAGTAVYSISLTEGVASHNDQLYEQKYNIHGYHNLNSEFQKLIKGLI